MKHFSSLQKSGYLNLIFQVIFLIICYFLSKVVEIDFSSKLGMVFLILVVLLPSIIWTIFFYLQDRIEPEPLSYLLLAFFLGVSIAELVGEPVQNYFFEISNWIYSSKTVLFFGSVFITGAVVSFSVYLVLRYVFYPLTVLDEPVDGMVYGAFIGCGYAFIESFHYLSNHPDFTLFSTAYLASVNILLYAGVSSVIGLFIGKAKFEGKNLQINAIYGLVLGSLIIGCYHFINEMIFIKGSGNRILLSIIFTLALSLSILVISFYRMRYLTDRDLHQEVKISFSLDWLVILIFSFFIVIGIILKSNSDQYKKFAYEENRFTLEYPKSFNALNMNPLSLIENLQANDSLENIRTLLNIQNDRNMVLKVRVKKNSTQGQNSVLSGLLTETKPFSYAEESVEINGKKAVRIKHSYFRTGENYSGYENFPSLVWNITDVIPADNYLIVLDFASPSESFTSGIKVYERVLKSLKFRE